MAPQSSDHQARIIAILGAASEIYENFDASYNVACIMVEHASRLTQQLDSRSEGSHELQKKVDDAYNFFGSSRTVDRNRDIREIEDFYKKYRKSYHIDRLESLGRLPNRNSNNRNFGKWREVIGISDSLEDTIDDLLRVVSRRHGSDEDITTEEVVANEDAAASSLRMLVKTLLEKESKIVASKQKLSDFVNNVVEELRARVTSNDFVTIQVWWATNCWGEKLYGKVHEAVQKVGTALHWAVELEDIKLVAHILDDEDADVNAVNWMKATPLHMAVLKANIDIVRQLLKCKDRIRLIEEDEAGRTPVEIAIVMGHTDIERALLEEEAVSRYVEALYKNRQVYVDAANAILVGAALIASVTFASWLQPPLGYTLDGHVDVQHNGGLKAFWVFNNLSFYFATGTVVFGARSVLPRQNVFIKRIVEKLRINLLVTSILLGCSVFFVIIAFGIAGCIVLTPILEVQWSMIAPTMVGGLVCLISLTFLFKSIWEESFGRGSGTSDHYLFQKKPSSLVDRIEYFISEKKVFIGQVLKCVCRKIKY